jgi:transposase
MTDLRLDALVLDEATKMLTLEVTSTQATPACPRCQAASHRVHSTYTRTLLDLPWADVAIRLQLQVRKCFCPTDNCSRTIFTERLEQIAAPWARRTRRLAEQQRHIGLALGGAASQRLGVQLDHGASRDTFIRLVRSTSAGEPPTPRILGVDDWARRKGHTYGSILVDIERGAVIDLLPDRTAETFAHWLQEHPGVEIISRDRAGSYAEGASQGAPSAVQVADRWHLLKNLGDALVHVFDLHRAAIEQQLRPAATATPPISDVTTVVAALASASPPAPATGPASSTQRQRAEQEDRRQRRLAQYEEIRCLRQQEWSLSAIADQLGLDRNTVRKYATASAFPEQQPRGAQPSLLDPFKPAILELWNGGCQTGSVILREMQARGYRGGQTTLLAYITQLRLASGVPPKKRVGVTAASITDPTERVPSSRGLTWLVLRKGNTLDTDERQRLDEVGGVHADIAMAISLCQEFAMIVRERRHEQLDGWLEQAEQSGLAPLVSFATGVRRDYAAVKAGVTLEYSNGPTEGHINRLKMVKRQMYGRAKLDLLKQRLIAA